MRKLRNGMIMEHFRRQLLGHNFLKKFKEFVQITGCFDDPVPNSSSAGREESNLLYARTVNGGLELGLLQRKGAARLMICTTAISNIESTLEHFKDEIEKEEAVTFKAYIRLAIANFAAVDTLPTPPKIPSYSRPNKGSGNSLGNNKNISKKVAIVTPQTPVGTAAKLGRTNETLSLPKLPKTTEETWATVTRKGHKKARVSMSKITQVAIDGKMTHGLTNKNKSRNTSSTTNDPSDKILFVRLSQEHEWRKPSPAGIRQIIVQKLMISPSLIGKIKSLHSGFALSPCSSEARDEILKAGDGLFMSGAKLEPATNWVSILVPTVPAYIHMEKGQVEITKSMLSDEIELVCSMRPAHLKLFGQNNPDAPHRTWMAYFSKAPRSGFRVFDESGIIRPYKRQQPLEFCKRCNGHHLAKNCSRAPSCGNCGSTNHTIDRCMAATKCRNCGGPHGADSRRCLARPTRSGPPTKEQMKC
ncbi:hypothetical protein EPUL_006204 [Erysiphe pulchra]|uniref:Uncharacterized protein n=1 Tax=Erysiphe pulchra TaxID=225359 RepID=A0A2S4PL29_9PEZI|nr:hypothetical protein EPUL_006204 [Erysiphe pulchra]